MTHIGINIYLPERQRLVAMELGLDTIEFRKANGDVYDGDTFEAIAAKTRETRSDSVHMTEIGYRNMAHKAFEKVKKYIEEEQPSALLVVKEPEPSLYDSVAVKVPTLVAVARRGVHRRAPGLRRIREHAFRNEPL